MMDTLKALCAYLLMLTLPICRGSVFHFYPNVVSKINWADNEQACKDLGYDGLAVINSPEAYTRAMDITEYWEDDKFHVGLRRHNDTGEILWDDGSQVVRDYPLSNKENLSFGQLQRSGKIILKDGTKTHYGLCGNHKHLPTEAHGTTAYDISPDKLTSILSETTAGSYLECAIMCSGYDECQAAQFDVHTKLCTIIAYGEYDGCLSASPDSTRTFFRERFKSEDPC